jgi:ABC-2 type transport system ATP-binding protein
VLVHPGSLRRVPGAFVASGLRKSYGDKEALRGVSLEVADGEVVGLLGPNGAGKSTLAKIACGLVRPTGGSAEVAGHPAGSPGARAAIGYLAELFRFPGWAGADDVLLLHQRLTGSAGGEGERAELLELVGLSDASQTRVSDMSKGMQQRLGIAQALVGAPHLLLLDEPTSALDPAGRRVVRRLLAELKQRGVSVLLSSHLLGEVELICDRVAILVKGEIVERGTPKELTRPRGIEVELAGEKRMFEGAVREDAPRIVSELVAGGQEIFGVRVLSSTLEDVYLEAVGEEAGE